MAKRRGRPPKPKSAITGTTTDDNNGANGVENSGGGINAALAALAAVKFDEATTGTTTTDTTATPDPIGGFTDPIGPAGPDPATGTVTAATGADATARKRGRPAGSRNTAKSGQVDISGIETLLLGIHTTLRHATGIQEFELDAAEANQIATAYADVARYYPSMAIAPQYAAIFNLCSVLSLTYGGRIVAYRMRMANERGRRRNPQAPVAPVAPSGTQAAPVQTSVTEAKSNGATPPPAELRKGFIPGVGAIEFPETHELFSGRKQ